MREKYFDFESLSEVSESILFQTPRPLRLSIYMAIALFVSLLVWSCRMVVDETVIAHGIVRPRGDVTVLQAPFAGKVIALFVKEGDVVKRGDSLLKLDVSDLEIKAAGLQVKMGNEATKLATLRLQKETIERQGQSVIAGARHKAEAAGIEIGRLLAEQRELTAIARQAEAEYRKASEALKRAQGLGHLISKAELESAQSDSDLKSHAVDAAWARVEENSKRQKAAEVKQKEAEAEIIYETEKLQNWLREHELRIRELALQLDDLKSQQTLYEHNRSDAVITASTEGVITQISAKNPGQVLRAGDHIASFAPRGSELILEAYIPNADAGRVKIGQAAYIKLEAFPYQNYGVLESYVSYVAEDAHTLRSESVYRVELTIHPLSNKKLELKPGMAAFVDIVTDQQKMAVFFLRKLKRQVY